MAPLFAWVKAPWTWTWTVRPSQENMPRKQLMDARNKQWPLARGMSAVQTAETKCTANQLCD